jgi:YegS/Rv2252/BmrU family lipid kinase
VKVLLIINPTAGKNVKRKMPPILKWTFKRLRKRVGVIAMQKTTPQHVIRAVGRACFKAKIKLTIEFTKYPRHATKLAKAAIGRYDMVIVAGGDGTVNEAINGIARTKMPLVIIPFGSTNVIASELGIPFDLKKATALIAIGKPKLIDLGYARTSEGGRYFSMMLGVGFTPSLIKNISRKFKKKWKRLAYPLAGIKNLFNYTWYNIHVDHKKKSVGYFIVISNSKNYGGEYQIADKASITDGLLDLVVIDRQNWWKLTKIISSIASGKSNKFLRGEYFQIKKAHVYSRHKMGVQVDGEVIGTLPVNVKVVPKGLNVMVN